MITPKAVIARLFKSSFVNHSEIIKYTSDSIYLRDIHNDPHAKKID